MKTTWDIIHKEINNSNIENNIKSLRINNHTVYNQISMANEFNNYFLNIVGSSRNNGINEIDDDACPLQYLFKYFKQPFKDMNWPYTSSKEINKIIDSLNSKNSSGYDEITTKIITISTPFITSPIINICNKMLAQGI
jgi:hypothetical protein